ncbi:cytochrome P450 [Ramaria rubella]|nr:cytochrome P450 [Ramaria rubella]
MGFPFKPSHILVLSVLLFEYNFSYAWAVFTILVVFAVYKSVFTQEPYDAIPAVGYSGFAFSYFSTLQFLKHGNKMLQEGYNKLVFDEIQYKPGPFRFPQMNQWHVILTGEKAIDELRKASDDVLSFSEATKDIVAGDYTLGPNTQFNPYHVGIVRGQLTRNLDKLFPDILDEIVQAFEDKIPVIDDWTPVEGFDTTMNIICRVSNRMFVGAPKCTCEGRDAEFVKLNVKFTIYVLMGASIINLFPSFLKPVAGRLFTKVPSAIKIGLKHLLPIINARQRMIDEYGFDYPNKPVNRLIESQICILMISFLLQNDVLSWLMDEACDEERTPRNLTLRVLLLNFASIHTSTMTFTHALYDLASRPEHISSIREEIESVISEEGWSKTSLTQSLRLHGISGVSMSRKALKDFTFSDGTHIPKGGTVSAIATARQRDNEVYKNGAEFDPFRFSNVEDNCDLGTNQMTATSLDYLPFGHGRHAW